MLNITEIKDLIKALDASTVTTLKLESPDGSIELKRAAVQGTVSVATTAAPPPQPEGIAIKAPLVGVVYARPKPEAEPFAAVGDAIRKGQTLCLVEAMKMFNEIKAPCDGVVQAVLFEEGQLVEFDQTLFTLGDAPC